MQKTWDTAQGNLGSVNMDTACGHQHGEITDADICAIGRYLENDERVMLIASENGKPNPRTLRLPRLNRDDLIEAYYRTIEIAA